MTKKEVLLIDELKKYCHKKGCENYRRCPQMCKCGKKLNLLTAMMWSVKYSLDLIDEKNKESIKYEKTKIHSYVMLLSYHQEKYHKEISLLKKVQNLLNNKLRGG